MVVLFSAILALVWVWPCTARSQELTVVEAARIAREGYVYGFPIVDNYKTMYAHAIDANNEEYKAPLNVLHHEARLVAPGDTSFVTPEVDTLYSFLWMDLRSGPLVLGVPAVEKDRYYAIQLVDLYNYNFAYVGSRATGNAEGRFLIAGPRWRGEAPAGVQQVIRSETEFALAIYRTQVRGAEDLASVKVIQKGFTVQPLSGFFDQAVLERATAAFPHPPQAEQPDLSFFSTLGFLLRFCPPHPADREVRASLARIGVAANARFDAANLPPEVQQTLRRGIRESDAAIAAAASAMDANELTGTREFLGNNYLRRAAGAEPERYGNSKEEIFSSLYLTDANGKPLDASENRYLLRLSESELPPVHAFWSITMYDGESQALVANAMNRHQITSLMLPSLEKNADGTLAILVQHASPLAGRPANWLPAPDGPFYLVMRLYWPRADVIEGSWTPPLLWTVDAPPPTPVPRPAGAEATEEVRPTVIADEPKPEMKRPAVWQEPTEVQVAIYVADVDEVDSAGQNFAASIYFEAHWKNPFLRHQGPDPTHRNLTDVWNPQLTVISQQMTWRSYPESVEIQPDGTVIYRQKIWGRFSQPLDLRDFPFDRQRLSVHLVAAGLMEQDVELVPLASELGRRSNIASSFSLPDFSVASWDASPAPYHLGEDDFRVAGYEMTIDVTRKATYYVLKIIIPLCLIVIMSWLPRWMDPEKSGTNVGVSTSAFLTLVAYLFAITVLLPRVSYVTRMDRFILLSMLTVFAGLIQTVANTIMIRHEQKRLAEYLDRRSRIVYPLLLVLVLVLSFVL